MRSKTDRVRRIGVLIGMLPTIRRRRPNIAALHQGLQKAGWVLGRNRRIEMRWRKTFRSAGASADQIRACY